jgi:hypothetical protein
LALTACGGSSSGASASARERAGERRTEAALANYARCLREHGVDVEIARSGLKIASGRPSGLAAQKAVQTACARYRPLESARDNPSPQEKVEQEERGRTFARCMREHAIKLEVRTSGNGARMLVGGREPNQESPAFQRAISACGGPKG